MPVAGVHTVAKNIGNAPLRPTMTLPSSLTPNAYDAGGKPCGAASPTRALARSGCAVTSAARSSDAGAATALRPGASVGTPSGCTPVAAVQRQAELPSGVA